MVMGETKPPRRTAFIATVGVATASLVVFAAWCALLVRDVSTLRGEVERRVSWLQVARELEVAVETEDVAQRRAALTSIDTELSELVARSEDDAALHPTREAVLRILRALDEDPQARMPAALDEALRGLVPDLRRQTAMRSAELGEHWDALYTLVVLAILFGTAALTLWARAARARQQQEHRAADRLEAQLLRADRLAALGTLAATVAHEINNPLTFLLANLDLIRSRLETSDDDELRLCLSEAEEGAQRVATIVADLRNLSHPGATGESVHVDVHKVLDASIRICEGEARQRARVTRDYAELPRVHADPARLGQVFLNLLVNAIQAIEPGAPSKNSVTVKTSREADGVSIEILDTGPGIELTHIERLFEPFVTTKEVGEGTGLGLYVCRSIVQSLGGSIRLEPVDGGGTRASVWLPTVVTTRDEEPKLVRIHDPAPAETLDLRILIIDDEELLASALARSLRAHEVHTANRGAVAIELATRVHFDVILCDLIMPEMTGMEVFEALGAHNPDIHSRFVFMTGATVTAQAQRFTEQVGVPVLRKPFSRAQLMAVLERYL